MIMRRVAAVLLLVPVAPALPMVTAKAASFDCGAAATPFERAICNTEALSLADERLAKAFATAMGGLGKTAAGRLRDDQRDWLDFAQRACTDGAEPLTTGSYDEDGAACLVEQFDDRVAALENSRMIDGHRFTIETNNVALPDPDYADSEYTTWKIATHTTTVQYLEADDPWAEDYNAFVRSVVESNLGETGGDEPDPYSNTTNLLTVKSITGTSRISLDFEGSWFGHGAAHGNYSGTLVHYFVPEGRAVEASDIFADDWQEALVEAAWQALQEQHGEALMIDSSAEIADAVVDPSRWDLDDPWALVIGFEPYEVSGYAYGDPSVRIPWETLDAFKAENQDLIRYGW